MLAELAERLGGAAAPSSGAALSSELFAEVSFYSDLTLERLAGHGLRWQELPAGREFADGDRPRRGAEAAARAERRTRQAPARELPLDLGLARGVRSAGTVFPGAAPARRARPARRRQARAAPRRGRLRQRRRAERARAGLPARRCPARNRVPRAQPGGGRRQRAERPARQHPHGRQRRSRGRGAACSRRGGRGGRGAQRGERSEPSAI